MNSKITRLKAQIKAGWEGKLPILLFVLSFTGVMTLFYLLMLSSFYENRFQPFTVRINAHVASFILNIFGEGTAASGDLIASNRISISIKRGCDALTPIFLFSSAVIAFPARWADKAKGLAMGVSLLLFINLIRIISLYWIQFYIPSIFDMMHLEVWQVIFIILAILFWVRWMEGLTVGGKR